MNKKNKILIISGDLLKHKYVAIKILKKFENSNIIFENYPKDVSQNYTKEKSKVVLNHFKKVKYYEKKYFQSFCKKNINFIKKKTLLKVQKGQLNTKKLLIKIKQLDPNLIILNATSLLKKNFIKFINKKIINIHAGLIPYYRGAGCNVWTFYNQELEYTGVSTHYVNDKIDDGKILFQIQSNFKRNDNTHSIGCKNAKLSARLTINTIKYLQKYPNYSGKRILSKKNKIYYKKDFTQKIIIKINKLINEGLVKDYCLKPKKIKIIKY